MERREGTFHENKRPPSRIPCASILPPSRPFGRLFRKPLIPQPKSRNRSSSPGLSRLRRSPTPLQAPAPRASPPGRDPPSRHRKPRCFPRHPRALHQFFPMAGQGIPPPSSLPQIPGASRQGLSPTTQWNHPLDKAHLRQWPLCADPD